MEGSLDLQTISVVFVKYPLTACRVPHAPAPRFEGTLLRVGVLQCPFFPLRVPFEFMNRHTKPACLPQAGLPPAGRSNSNGPTPLRASPVAQAFLPVLCRPPPHEQPESLSYQQLKLTPRLPHSEFLTPM